MLYRGIAVARKELWQILRDRQTLIILLVVPVFFLLLYGYALNFDIRNIPLAVEDRDRSAASRKAVAAFVNSGYFDLVGDVRSPDELRRLLDRNEARAVLTIPENYAERLLSGRTARVQVIIDGDNANTATTVMAYTQAIVRDLGGAPAVIARGAGGPPIVLEPRVWYNPELRSTLFLAPGLIAYIAMITGVISTALSLVRERERGTMEQIRMAPVDTFTFVVGKSIPYFVLSLVSAFSILFAAMTLFDMPMRGSWALLALATSLFLAGALATGLLISTVAETQQVAFQMALLASFLPTFILSGFIFPIGSMPAVVQAFTYLVPARYYLVALRGIVLKGVGLEAFGVQLAALAIYAAVVLSFAAVRLARRGD